MQNLKMIAVSAVVTETSIVVNQRQIYVFEKMQLLNRNDLLSESDIEKTIKNVLKLHKDIFYIIQYLNSSFGVPLLLIFLWDMSELLSEIDNILNVTYKKMVTELDPQAQLFHNITYLSVLLVISVSIAIAGDKIEKTGIKITKLCHILEVDIKNPIIRGHVRNLSGYLEKLRPALTLAGFIPINRNIIPLLLSSLTSYAIILIQLKS
ncbi:uncharacterized protein [Diabrotica undecimpunctata]|uniref:uncharacterized protein n=1 Tax=Diabrotica undecimpunctata TaxID=50387 RepID=UPI003B64260C